MASSLMASQTLILRNPSFLSPQNSSSSQFLFRPKHLLNFSKLRAVPFLSTPKQPLALALSFSNSKPPLLTLSKSRVFSCSSSATTIPNSHSPTHTLLTGSTRTITTILAITLSLTRLFVQKIRSLALKLKGFSITPSPRERAEIHGLQQSLACVVGPLFFAALKDRPAGYLNTPLTVVAAGMAKLLNIYSGVLMVRVFLSWFPNIPQDRQPFSAIWDLCDTYLDLFGNIIPPTFDLGVSPFLAFAVLGMLGSILNNIRGAY